MSSVKERHYFGKNSLGRTEAEYLALFRGARENQAVGEASVSKSAAGRCCTALPKKPPMAEATRRLVQEKFRGYIECLEELLGRTLPLYHRKNDLERT